MRRFLAALIAAACLGIPASALAAPLKTFKVQVDGQSREGLMHLPANPGPSGMPVVFVFHGHGQTAQMAAEKFAIHEHLPEALCLYLQGLPTPTGTDPQAKHPGWQKEAGELGDRDLHLFDAALAKLKQQYKIDSKRIYAAGFSNGGFFTYLLWARRGDVLAATAVCAAQVGDKSKDLKPKGYLHIAGKADEQVPFDSQQLTVNFIRKLDGCADAGEPWNQGVRATALFYPSKSGTPCVSVIHSGGHEVPEVGARLVAKFFKEH